MTARPCKVLVVGPSSQGRGGIATVMRWFETLDADALPGYEFSSAASHPGTEQRTLRTAWRSLLASDDVMRRIRRERPDIVHLLVGPRGSLVRKARIAKYAERRGARVVVHLHSGAIDETLMGERNADAPEAAVTRLLKGASVVATLWQGPRRGMRRYGPNALWHIVGNALPEARETSEPGERDIDVLFAGRVSKEKGSQVLVALASMLGDEGLTLTVAGVAEADGDVVWNALASSQHVDLLGWIEPEHIPELVSRARVLIMPSRTESLPIAALEAMQAGCAVVASPVGALPELLGDGRGVCVDGGPSEWTVAVRAVLADPQAAEKMGAAASRYAREHYDRAAVLGQLAEAYTSAIADTAPPTRREGRVEILGFGVDSVTVHDAVERAISAARQHEGGRCVNMNASNVANMPRSHVLRVAFRDPFLSIADGASMVWASQELKCPLPERVAGVDFGHQLLSRCAEEGVPVFLLGASADTLDATVSWAETECPGIRIVGKQDGYYDDPDAVAATIRDSGARVLLVGMTSPIGDGFCLQFADELAGIVSVVVGGSFEVWAGNVPRAPHWMRRIWMEWLFRLVQEPRRLLWRYASTNTLFIGRVLEARARRLLRRV